MKDFLYTIILLGAIQGVIICSLLFFNRKQILSNRLLAFIIGLITLPGIHLYFHYTGLFDTNELVQFIHDIVPLVVIMPLGPLIYFYIRSMLEPGFKLGRKEKMHFIPVVIDLLPKLVALVFYAGKLFGWSPLSREQLAKLVDVYSQYADLPRWVSMTIYVFLAARWLQAYKNKKQDSSNTSAVPILRWLQLFTRLFIAFQLIWLVYLVPYILSASSGWLLAAVDWFPIYIPMSVLVYWLGIKGWLVAQPINDTGKKTNNGSLSLPEQVIGEALGLLKKSMEEDRLYLNPALNLEKLSLHTGLSPKNISAILNQHMETSFNAFINQYRVEEFKLRLSMPGGEHLTIVGLAMECGFNSPATFQRTFKQCTGLSPTAFRKTLEKGVKTAFLSNKNDQIRI